MGKELDVTVMLDTPDKIVSTADGLRLVFNPADTRELSELGGNPHDDWSTKTALPVLMGIIILPSLLSLCASFIATLFGVPETSYWMFLAGGLTAGVIGDGFFVRWLLKVRKYRKLWREIVSRTTTALESWVYKQYQLVFEPEDMQLWVIYVLDGIWQRNTKENSTEYPYLVNFSRLSGWEKSPVISSSTTGRQYRLEQNSKGLWVVSPVPASLRAQSELKKEFAPVKKGVNISSPALSGLSAYTNGSGAPVVKMPRKVAARVEKLENRFAVIGSQVLNVEGEHVVLRARGEFTEAMERFNRLQVLNVDGSSDLLDVVNGLIAELDDVISDEVELLRKGSAKQRELLRARQSEKSGLRIESE